MTTEDKRLCDFCSGRSIGRQILNPNADKAKWDGPTRMGVWAYMCDRHLESAGYPGSSMNRRLKEEKSA